MRKLRDAELEVDCKSCKAKAGNPCVNKKGAPTQTPHGDRMQDWYFKGRREGKTPKDDDYKI